jgi:hypothetical protein
MYSQTPDSEFFDTFRTAFEQLEEQTTNALSAESLIDVLGATQTEMAELRGVSAEDQLQYAAILNEAYASGDLEDPQQYLQSLSSSALDVVRRMHGLADTICATTLSNEGASNLLLPEGYSVDLDRDGIDEVGTGMILHFPPRDAPAAFTNAWFQATQDLKPGDYALHSMTLLLAFHPPGEARGLTSAFCSSDLSSYRTIVDNYLSMLENCRGMLAEGQYERDQPFFSHLQELLQEAS